MTIVEILPISDFHILTLSRFIEKIPFNREVVVSSLRRKSIQLFDCAQTSFQGKNIFNLITQFLGIKTASV